MEAPLTARLKSIGGHAEGDVGVLVEQSTTNHRQAGAAVKPVVKAFTLVSVEASQDGEARILHASHHSRPQDGVAEHIDKPRGQEPVLHLTGWLA